MSKILSELRPTWIVVLKGATGFVGCDQAGFFGRNMFLKEAEVGVHSIPDNAPAPETPADWTESEWHVLSDWATGKIPETPPTPQRRCDGLARCVLAG